MYATQKLLLLTSLLSLAFCKGPPPAQSSRIRYPISNHTIPLIPPLEEYEGSGFFGAEVFVGTQLFALAMDTGSSDTWVLATDVNCTDVLTLQPSDCGLTGPQFDRGSSSFEVIPDVHLNQSYVLGSCINGPLGYTELILGGLTIPKQEMSAITYSSFGRVPLGNLSGLVGLAYPGLTGAFPGTDPSKDIICKGNSSCGPIPYPPLVNTLFQDGSLDLVFSFAMSRSKSFGGVMTIGGIPRLNELYVNATGSTIAISPMRPIGNTTIPNFYTTEVESIVCNNATLQTGQGRYIVDTGTIPNIFTKEEADAINALFTPPAVYNATEGYVVACDAKAPELGINIDGQIFYHNPKDMIVRRGDVCLSAVQASAAAKKAPVLGATFLKNVLAVFDVGASEMTFVSRTEYEDS